MSTKAILTVLTKAHNGEDTTPAEDRAAFAELEAIRKVAKDLESMGFGWDWITPKVRDAFAVLSAIAKEEPHGQ